MEKGMSQVQLAELMNLTQASISQFEKGQRLPTPANINKFANILDVSWEFLAGDAAGQFEKSLLMRNIKGLSPENLRKINDYIDFIKHQERSNGGDDE